MQNPLFCLSLGIGLAIFAGTAGYGQSRNCAPREVIVDRLSSHYGETRQSIGLGANNALVEVFASESTGTWTITVTAPGGSTCLVASGRSFEHLAEAAVKDLDDA
ncbi:MAG: hypothetical protein AAGD04_09760 [Pseudomonadota bacterium]